MYKSRSPTYVSLDSHLLQLSLNLAYFNPRSFNKLYMYVRRLNLPSAILKSQLFALSLSRHQGLRIFCFHLCGLIQGLIREPGCEGTQNKKQNTRSQECDGGFLRKVYTYTELQWKKCPVFIKLIKLV